MQGGGCLAPVGSPQPPGVIPEHHQTWQQNQKENNTKAGKGRLEEVCGVGWRHASGSGARVWG